MKKYILINVFLWIITISFCKNSRRIYTYDINSISLQKCDDESYRCYNGSCIPEKYYCNGMIDCSSGEDEKDCQTCPLNYCSCTDGLCIGVENVCNMKTDCIMEGEDEMSCTDETDILRLVMWNFYAPEKRCTITGPYYLTLDCSDMNLVSLPCVIYRIEVLILNNNNLGWYNGLSDLSFAGFYHNSLTILELENNDIENLPIEMFKHTPNLIELSLAGNYISHLDGVTFPRGLERLDLRSNGIENLPSNVFDNLRGLKNISLAYNQIKYLDEDMFANLDQLKILNLSWNSIKTLRSNTFSSLINLEIFDLSHNEIEVIADETFYGLKNLTTLYLNSNRLTKLEGNMFQSLKNLTALFLQHNRICIMENETFNGLTELKILDLSHNEVTHLGMETFQDLNSITMLMLNDNFITEVHNHTFSELHLLQNLFANRNNIAKLFDFPRCNSHKCSSDTFDVSGNEIVNIENAGLSFTNYNWNRLSLHHNMLTTLKSGMFNDTTIRSLELNDNRISTIENCTFKGLQSSGSTGSIFLNSNNLVSITTHMFKGIKGEWHLLSLKDNKITTIEDDAFEPFDSLEFLDLSSNALSEVTANMFRGLKIISHIALQDNQIETIERHSFHDVTFLNIVNLSNNRLTKLHSNTFQGCYFLKSLYFQNNIIENIEKDAFHNLPFLEILDLSNNRLTKLYSDMLQSLHQLQELYLQNNKIKHIEANTFRGLPELLTLDVSDNMIAELRRNMFEDLLNLKTLSLQRNKVKNIEDYAFKNLEMLITLDLSENEITSLLPNILLDTRNLRNLYLHNNKIGIIDEFAFSELTLLSTLNLKNNAIGDVNPNIFKGLRRLKNLIVDEFRFCCLKRNIKNCESPIDEFSSCEDLMKNSILRTFVWILGIVSIFANSFVIIFRIKYQYVTTNQVNSFLIKNLAMSDLLMGVYLLIIATTDTIYRGEYYMHDKYWRESYWCNLAGFLSTFSSELTVFILTILSVDRLYTINFPMQAKQRGINRTKGLIILVWILAMIISLVPLPFFNIRYFTNFYGRSGVCLPLHITTDTPTGWQYSVFIFIILNAILFGVIALCYFTMYRITCRARRSITSSNRAGVTVMAYRMTLLVMADAACWIPIITLGIRSLMGAHPSRDVYPWIAVFILPLNAALNPILYTISSIPAVIKVKFSNTRLNGRLVFTWPCRWVTANKIRKSEMKNSK